MLDHRVGVGARSVGARVLRAEDPRILTGRGRYIDDVVLPGMLHAAFLRSQIPHGVLRSVDASEARQLPGVVAVYTGEDMARMVEPARAGATIGINMMPGMRSPAFYALATDRVRYVGDPIAMVVAEDRYIAEDALELIVEDIEMLEPIVTYEDALDPAKPPLFDEIGDNIAFSGEMALGDVDAAFARADRVVRATVSVHRHQPVPMEGRGLVATWDADQEHLTIHASTQSPHMLRLLMPPQIGVPMEQHPGAGRRRRRRVRAQERGVPGRHSRGGRLHGPAPAGQVDRGPLGAPGVGRPGPRGDGRYRGRGHR